MPVPVLLLLAACNGPTTDPDGTYAECVAPSGGGEPAAVLTGPPPRNLLVLSIDTLRRDRIGRYARSDSTPFLDARLDEALVLDDLRGCANWTLPGVSCVQSGQSPLERGIDPVSADPDYPDQHLPEDTETLATWLSAAGFDARLASGSKLFSDAYPLGNGFGSVVYDDDARADEVSRLGLEALGAVISPWYVHLHFRDPHSPYRPPERYQGALAGVDLGERDPRTDDGLLAIARAWHGLEDDERAALYAQVDTLYQGELRYLDDQLAELWAELDARGALDDTLVVFWSDHGEQFFEHDSFQHGNSLQQEESMALGAFWARSLTPVAWEGPTMQVDLAPTILSILGQPIPDSVTGLVVGTAPDHRVRISSSKTNRDVPLQSVDQDGWRMLYKWTGERRLYDVPNDPAEVRDLYGAQRSRVKCLWELLAPAVAAVDPEKAGMEAVGAGP